MIDINPSGARWQKGIIKDIEKDNVKVKYVKNKQKKETESIWVSIHNQSKLAPYESMKIYRCSVFCHKLFYNQDECRAHERDCKMAYQCIRCDAKYDNVNDLKTHIAFHATNGKQPGQQINKKQQNKTFECKQCNATIATKQEWINHMNAHNGNFAYKCEYSGCSKKFLSITDRLDHQKSRHPVWYQMICGQKNNKINLQNDNP